MAANRWIGKAQNIAQVNTVTVGGAPALGQTYTVTINTKTVTYTATGPDTNLTIAAALLVLLQASTVPPEFLEITWAATSPASAAFTGTAKVAGTPFTQTSSASGTGTLATSTTTASASQSDLGNTVNYSLGALPGNGDDFYIDNSKVPILWNLNALAGVTLNSLNIDLSFTGKGIGLPEVNTNGAPYEEYRPTYMAVGATTVNYGTGTGQGCSRFKLNTGSVQTTFFQFGSGPQDGTLGNVQWIGTNAANVINVLGGSMDIAIFGGNLATVQTLRMGGSAQAFGGAVVRLGAGVTLTNIVAGGGTLTIDSAVVTLTKNSGTLTVYGSGTVGTLNELGGTTHYNGTGTISTVNIAGTGTLDLSGNPAPLVITTANVYAGSTINDPLSRVGTWTIHEQFCDDTQWTHNLGLGASGAGRTITAT